MQWLLYVFIIVAGVVNGLQAGMNAQLNKTLGQTILAAPIVYLSGLAGILIVSPFLHPRLGDYSKLADTPWWAYCGGLTGAVFVYAMLATAQKIGAGAFTALTVTAGLVTSVAMDHFGALGMDRHPINVGRVIGVLLMLGGVALVARF